MECAMLGAFLMDMAEVGLTRHNRLEWYVGMEVLEKNYMKLTFPAETKLTLTMGQALALLLLLKNAPMYDELQDVFRNNILDKINRQTQFAHEERYVHA